MDLQESCNEWEHRMNGASHQPLTRGKQEGDMLGFVSHCNVLSVA